MGGELSPTRTEKLEQTLSTTKTKNWELGILENDHKAPLSSAKKGHPPRGKISLKKIVFFMYFFKI